MISYLKHFDSIVVALPYPNEPVPLNNSLRKSLVLHLLKRSLRSKTDLISSKLVATQEPVFYVVWVSLRFFETDGQNKCR